MALAVWSNTTLTKKAWRPADRPRRPVAWAPLAAHLSRLSYATESVRVLPNDLAWIASYEGATLGGLAYVATGVATCHVVFRGTANDQDKLVDFRSRFGTACTTVDNEVFAHCGEGFFAAYQGLRAAGLGQQVASLVDEGRCDQGLFLTGHSLGGALASIMSADLEAQGFAERVPLTVNTFGEPRALADVDANRLHTRLHKTRWVAWGDPFTFAVSDTWGFRHFGSPRLIYVSWSGDTLFRQETQDYTPYSLNPVKAVAHKISNYEARLADCEFARP